MNCDLIYNKNSVVIQLGTPTVNVLRKLQVKYNTVKVSIAECNPFNYNKKNHSIPGKCFY